MTAQQQALKERQIREALVGLVGNPNFGRFMDVIREQREVAIEDACTNEVIANERVHMAAVGEIRAYKSILAAYEDIVANPLPREASD